VINTDDNINAIGCLNKILWNEETGKTSGATAGQLRSGPTLWSTDDDDYDDCDDDYGDVFT
jgi:hypothetical protein